MIAIDGSAGIVTADDVPLEEPEVTEHFETVLGWADELRDARRARQRRHARGRRQGARVRRRGDRAVPDRAHVHGRRPPAQDAGDDHGRVRGGPPQGARRAAPAPAGGLRGAVRRDERPAGDDPAARPAAARVPPAPPRTSRRRSSAPASRSRTTSRSSSTRSIASTRCRRPTRCSARAACGSACCTPRSTRCRCGRSCARRWRSREPPRGRDHDPAGRLREGARADARAGRAGRGGGGRRGARPADRHDDRAAAGVLRGGSDRRARRLLLVRHQRPHPDRARLLARRRRGQLPHPLHRAQGARPQPVRDDRQARRRLARAAGRLGGPRGQPGAQARHLRRARRRPRLDRASSSWPGSTT